MSNGRSHRRKVTVARTRALLDDAAADAPGLVVFGSGQGDGSLVQPIKVGQVLYAVAVPPKGASDRLLWAYSARATASVTGTCPAFGAGRHVQHRGHAGAVRFLHEADCPAADDNITAAVRAEQAA